MSVQNSIQLSLPEGKGPLHERLADAVEQLISGGRYGRGDRLPTHRELARGANVAIGTVTKAIDLLERRGVVRGETGRGTFVNLPVAADDELVDLNFNVPLPVVDEAQFRAAASLAASRLGSVPNGGYPEPGGGREQRMVVAAWLAAMRLEVDPNDLLITIGGQHGIHLAMADLAGTTKSVATEAATFSGAIAAARNLSLDLLSVDHDGQGMLPADLHRVLATTGCKAVYLTPVCQNPFGFEMGAERRQEILDICRRHDAYIIEDDIYSLYAASKAKPFHELAPDRVYYLNGLSKSLTPLVRVGLLIPPRERRTAIASRVRAEVWGASPFDLEVARALVEGEAHLKARDILQPEARHRVALASRLLGLDGVPMPQGAPHLWLPMTTASAENLARRALERGVRVTPPDATAVGGDKSGGVRLCLMSPSQRASLERALRIIADLLQSPSAEVV
ncbi:aminotransferase-like domain-containing protein [Oceanibacterium hippocampi]|uniref:Putative HTH-type transcriptional regulator YdcR n=1 Tax=Oceanibacterium hippocampi TaxID=745714 RepID=A0A1Y5SSM4_9PROT|nr:PLP-dependent aminotransferase family protein [Oceanibacterium hippocampi]SLN47094.1 putative HTH-type transcriptional regulator YdcR [Oceanibacterium hippocampi]